LVPKKRELVSDIDEAPQELFRGYSISSRRAAIRSYSEARHESQLIVSKISQALRMP
jgi:hypothetical protein